MQRKFLDNFFRYESLTNLFSPNYVSVHNLSLPFLDKDQLDDFSDSLLTESAHENRIASILAAILV
jgi:hypothetical protein